MKKNTYLKSNRLKLTGLISLLALIALFSLPSKTKAAADSSLSFSPQSKTVSTGEAFTLDAVMNPGSHHVSAVELFITYDQTKISLTKIACSSTFGTSLLVPAIPFPENGKARIDCGISLGISPVENQTVASTLSFAALSEEVNESPVAFADSSIAAADDEPGVNELGTKNGSLITITKPGVKTYTVTPSSGENGTISPNISQTADKETSLQFIVAPDEGYSASVGGTCGGTLSGTTYTIKVIADCTVKALFSKITPPPSGNGAGDENKHFPRFQLFYSNFKNVVFRDIGHNIANFFRFRFRR
jgi:hypothetical protein